MFVLSCDSSDSSGEVHVFGLLHYGEITYSDGWIFSDDFFDDVAEMQIS